MVLLSVIKVGFFVFLEEFWLYGVRSLLEVAESRRCIIKTCMKPLYHLKMNGQILVTYNMIIFVVAVSGSD